MTDTSSVAADRIAAAVCNGDARELCRLLGEHPECLAFLDLPARLTGSARSWCEYAELHNQGNLSSLFMFELPPDPVHVELAHAQKSADVERLRRLLAEHPRYFTMWGDRMLIDAASEGQIAVVDLLLDMGADINASSFGSTALSRALTSASEEMVEYLLSRAADANGADPDGQRAIICAISREPEDMALRLVKLLVEHGADVNREYTVFGDKNDTFTALQWATGKPTVAEYLRSKGATERAKKAPGKRPHPNPAEEIVAYFQEHFGPSRPQAQIEIVPTDPPISIHVIPAAEDRKHVTLFTTGMSEQPMNVPDASDDFRLTELFIQLPGDWPTDKKSLAKPKYAWPINWLRSIAKYPHQNNTWLGGPVTIIANGDPPEPLAPGLKFTSLLVMADRSFTARDGHAIYLYRLLPLYTEERNLEIKKGIAALLRAFDKHDTPSVVDLNRPNVGLGK